MIANFAYWHTGELGWMMIAARDTISQIFLVRLVTTMIGFAHLHHVVVGTVEVRAGVLLLLQGTLLDTCALREATPLNGSRTTPAE